MGWLRKLLGREQVNPEEYEQVRCDVCGGEGMTMLGSPVHPADQHTTSHQCWKCGGKGRLLVKRSG
jgi:DnaJ-class molecular chaperone